MTWEHFERKEIQYGSRRQKKYHWYVQYYMAKYL